MWRAVLFVVHNVPCAMSDVQCPKSDVQMFIVQCPMSHVQMSKVECAGFDVAQSCVFIVERLVAVLSRSQNEK